MVGSFRCACLFPCLFPCAPLSFSWSGFPLSSKECVSMQMCVCVCVCVCVVWLSSFSPSAPKLFSFSPPLPLNLHPNCFLYLNTERICQSCAMRRVCCVFLCFCMLICVPICVPICVLRCVLIRALAHLQHRTILYTARSTVARAFLSTGACCCVQRAWCLVLHVGCRA